MVFQLLLILGLTHIAVTWALAIRYGLSARRRSGKAGTEVLPQPSVSVLVPAWNERGTIEGCIQSLKQINYPDWEALILAGGPDGTYEAALQASGGDRHFRLLERGPEPKNAALNRGIQVSTSQVVVLLDADSRVSPVWLAELVKPLVMGASVSVGHRIPKKATWATDAEQMEDVYAFEVTGANPVYGDSSIAVWRAVLDRLGRLPTDAFGKEDWIIEVMLGETEGYVGYAHGALLYTNRPATFRESWHYTIRNHQSQLGGLRDNCAKLLQSPWRFAGLSYYFLAVFAFLSTLVVAFLLHLWRPDLGMTLPRVMLLALFWFVFRHMSLSIAVAVYKKDISWLSRSCAVLLMYAIRYLTVIPAVVAGRLRDPYYKGPRV